MGNKRLSVLTAFVLAMTAGLALPAAAGAAPTDGQIADSIRFRHDMGFASEPVVVEASYADTDKYSDHRWGVPLTPAEAADMDRRAAERPKIQAAIDYAIAEPTSAGMYLDQAKGGKPVFLFQGDVEQQSKAIGGRLPEGVDYAVEQVEYSMHEMRVLQATVTDDLESLTAKGIPVAQISVGVERNRVLVGLERETTGARQYLQERYGPMVSTEFIGPSESDECHDRGDCRQIKGGLRMGRGGDFLCTTGFNGKRRDNGSHVVLTAGHCLWANDGVGQCAPNGPEWKHNGNRFGCARGHTLNDEHCDKNDRCDSDVGWIKTDDGSGDPDNEDIAPRNTIMASDEYDLRSIERVIAQGDLAVNDTVCRAGGNLTQGNEWKCGKVKDTCANKPNGVGNWMILCVATVNFDSLGGDSGGPYIRTDNPRPGISIHWAVGIHSHSSEDPNCDTCRSWFTKANKVEAVSPADICTTYSC